MSVRAVSDVRVPRSPSTTADNGAADASGSMRESTRRKRDQIRDDGFEQVTGRGVLTRGCMRHEPRETVLGLLSPPRPNTGG